MSELPPVRTPGEPPTESPFFQLAIDEHLLYGKTDADRVALAGRVGVKGIEFHAKGLRERLPELNAILKDSPVRASSIHLGTDYDFLAPDEPTRQRALDQLRYAMTDAVDIGASAVVIVPQPGAALGLPDLMPYKAPIQLAVELMVWHLRSLSDLAYVFGIQLYMHPVNRYETGFLTRLDQGHELRRRIKFHKHVMLAADTYHMTFSEQDPITALETYHESVEHVYLAENNGALAGSGGSSDFARVANVLRQNVKWAVITRYDTRHEVPRPRELMAAVEHLKAAGFGA